MTRAVRIAIGSLGGLLLALLAGGGAIAWQASHGGIGLGPVIPWIEARLDADAARFRTDITDASLVWDRDAGAIRLRIEGARLLEAGGATALAIPEGRLTLDGPSLLRTELRPTGMAFSGLRVLLSRGEDGSFQVGLQGDEQQAASTASGLTVDDILQQLDQRSGVLAELGEVRISDAAVTLVNLASGAKLEARDGDLDLVRDRAGVIAGRLAFLVTAPGGDGRITLDGSFTRDQGWQALQLEVDRLTPAVLAPLLPEVGLARLDFPVSGRATLASGAEVRLWPMDLELEAEKAAFAWQSDGPPLAIDRIAAKARVDGAAQSLVIEHLTIDAAGTSASLAGSLSGWSGPVDADLRLEAGEVALDTLQTLWPATIAPAARNWVATSLQAGRASGGEIRLRLAGYSIGAPLPADAIEGGFDFEGVSLRYLPTMPPVTGIHGRAEFDHDGLHFTIPSATSAGIRLDRATVDLTGLAAAPTLAFATEVASTVPEALALLAHPPAEAPQKLGIDPATTSGTVSGKVTLHMPVPPPGLEAIQYQADLQLAEVALPDLVGAALPLTGLAGSLRVDRDGAGFDGKGQLAAVPFTARGQSRFTAREGDRLRLHAEAVLDRDRATALGVTLPAALGGELPVALELGLPVSGAARYDITADLGPLTVAENPLGWTKQAGSAGKATASLLVSPEWIAIERFALQGPALDGAGSAELARQPMALTQFHLDRLRLGDNDLGLRLERGSEGYHLAIDARRLVLDPTAFGGEAGGDVPMPPALTVQLTVAELRLGKAVLADLRGAVRHQDGRWRNGELAARLGGGQEPARGAALSLDEAGRDLVITSDDGAALGEAFGLPPGLLQGGTLRIEATLGEETPVSTIDGRLELRRFRIEQLPALARLATLLSLSGMVSALEGSGTPFQLLEVPFHYQGDTVRIDKARLVGSQLGLSARGNVLLAERRLDLEGTVVPAYTVNKVLGNIPILGWLMRGEQAEGAFAATFTVTGPLDAPEVGVNPLAALVPGVIRDLFSGVEPPADGEPAPAAP